MRSLHANRSCSPKSDCAVERVIAAAFWLGLALALAGIGVFIGNALESTMLGVLGANLIAIVAVSIVMAGGGEAGRANRTRR